jgi:hypothetical protein
MMLRLLSFFLSTQQTKPLPHKTIFMSGNEVMQLPPTKAKTQPKETFSSSLPPASPKQ